MKRVICLLLALCCTAFMRVQPVELGLRAACTRCHCKTPGDCGMPCAPAAAAAPVMFAAEHSARIARPAAESQPRATRPSEEKFFAPFVESPTSAVGLDPSALMVATDGVPLFKAHCSFLI
jgi:hypothetical protein